MTMEKGFKGRRDPFTSVGMTESEKLRTHTRNRRVGHPADLKIGHYKEEPKKGGLKPPVQRKEFKTRGGGGDASV
jgi:hypothetical protein